MVDRYTERLEQLLSHHLEHILEKSGPDQISIGFSGGLDCSVIASICSRYRPVQLYVVGTESALDIASAEAGAEILELPLKKIKIEQNDVKNAVPEMVDILRTRNALEISIELSFYFLCKNVEEKVILTGQGADELFGGYSRYLRMSEFDRAESMKTDVLLYLNHSHPQEQRLAEHFGKSLEPTYMTPNLVDYVGSLPMDYKIRKSERKFILKELGRNIGLPAEIVNKPKKAVQYGSGTLNLLRSLAKQENKEIHEYLKAL